MHMHIEVYIFFEFRITKCISQYLFFAYCKKIINMLTNKNNYKNNKKLGAFHV